MATCQAHPEFENHFVYGLISQTNTGYQGVGNILGKPCTFRFPEFSIEFQAEDLNEERDALCKKTYAALTPLRELLATDEWLNYSDEYC
jgi:hypothetical protein